MGKISLKGQNIIVTSNEPWEGMWFSKHNYAHELSKYNTVIFINPQKKWRLKNIFGCRIKVARYYKNLYILDYNNILPIINRFVFYLNNYLVSSSLKRYFRKKGFSNILMWAFDPFRLCNPKQLGVAFSIYHAVDPYNFRPYGETSLCKNVDVIFCIANYLEDQYKKFKKPIYLVPHGISIDEFSVDIENAPEIPFKDYGLYIGSMGNLNYSLIKGMLKQHPETPFLFIGQLTFGSGDAEGSELFIEKKYPNLHYHEAVDFKKLKYFIQKSKFCLVPKSYLTASPHKVLQYLAFGKPVFGCYMDHFSGNNELLYMSREDEEILRWMKDFLTKGEDPELALKRINYAKENTFERIFEKVEEYLSN